MNQIPQQIYSTLIWIGAVKRGEAGYLISEEIFNGICALADEYKRMQIAEVRTRAQRSAAGKAKTPKKLKAAKAAAQARRIPDDQASASTLYQRRRRAKLKRLIKKLPPIE